MEKKQLPSSAAKADAAEELEDPFHEYQKDKSIASREGSYRQQRFKASLSPAREDPFGSSTTPLIEPGRDYADILSEAKAEREKSALVSELRKRAREPEAYRPPETAPLSGEATPLVGETPLRHADEPPADAGGKRRKTRWDEDAAGDSRGEEKISAEEQTRGEPATAGLTPPPMLASGEETPVGPQGPTPLIDYSRQQPAAGISSSSSTSSAFAPAGAATASGSTPFTSFGFEQLTNEMRQRLPLTAEEIDALLPKEGYEIVEPPAEYAASLPPVHEPLPGGATLYDLPESSSAPKLPEIPGVTEDLGDIVMKPEDYHSFAKLFSDVAEEDLTEIELKEREVAVLLLKIKNGEPPTRRIALRTITERAKELGAGPLFSQILPLMMQSTLEDHERHLLVKVIDRVLYKLDERIRPYVHKILVVVEPLLIDEDYYARVEGREIISNLAKAAGLATIIATMRPDIDHPDEYVRNTTARAFAVVASSLGINSLLLFLRAVCNTRKSWQARHTGIKIIQQIAILMGCAVLPYLKKLVEIVQPGLHDEQQKVRTISALAIAALAEAACPYGIEAFDSVLRPLWQGTAQHRGKGLAAFLKAIGNIIPLMDPRHAGYYTKEVMTILLREFSTPDDEMKRIVLKVVRQCVATEGIEVSFVRSDILLPFFRSFWVVRNALEKRNAREVVDTTVEIANRVGGSEIVERVTAHTRDGSEPFRRMAVETIALISEQLGLDFLSPKAEELLVDGLLFAFQEYIGEDSNAFLNAFGVIVTALGARCKPYLPQITGVLRWRLNTPSSRNRQLAADLIARVAAVMKVCEEEEMLNHLGLFLFEYLGEEYPEVLGSILGALKAIVNVVGMQKMTPPIKDLLPRLTPILKNRHEKVQENVIDLVGSIADRGGDLVSPKEWDRICFDLLELLRAHKKGIRRAAVNTFGYIARAIGPFDVLLTLLNNLRVQERQLRICTNVAIAIVAEACQPYTVVPALMNEYRLPELNVRNGVLKSISFMFEYIGELSSDYVDTLAPLLTDGLMDRDTVHRQTACWACKHLALGVQFQGRERALLHLLNYVWPNIFETTPHLIQAFMDAVDGFRVSLGPGVMLAFVLQGLFHPARKVRESYWRVYNVIYIGHQDALLPYLPELPPDGTQRSYRRDALYWLI